MEQKTEPPDSKLELRGAVAANIFPSPDMPTAPQYIWGKLFEFQVAPEFVERKSPLILSPPSKAAAASSFVPSADAPTEDQYAFVIVAFVVHVAPLFVETSMFPGFCPAIRVCPSAEEATQSQALVPAFVKT